VALGILKRMGCTNIVTAEDGEAALEALHAAGGVDAFDVILMDLHMPKKGGLEAVRDIRRTWPRYRTKIIAVTADAFEDTRDNCIAVGRGGWEPGGSGKGRDDAPGPDAGWASRRM
jgi:CheY-like chemotaxis protein